MDIPKDQKRLSENFDWNEFKSHVLNSYKDFDSPEYFFAKNFFEKQKYPKVVNFIKSNFEVLEDSEPNTDVSYGYIAKKNDALALIRLSMVGPYFFITSITSEGTLIEPGKYICDNENWKPFIDFMNKSGFIFTTSEILKNEIIFDGEQKSIYSIIYSYENEPEWVGNK